MKKMIKIDNHEYFMQASAYTQFAYKDETGRSFLADIQSLMKLTKNKTFDLNSIKNLDKVTELLLKISYIMIKEADESQVKDYKSFVKSVESLYSDEKWIYEVITLAVTPISRQLQSIAQ